MDKFLRPERFEGSEGTTPAQWSHWFRTFSNFLDSIGPSTPEEDKLKILINYISPSVFSHISDASSYSEAIDTLKAVYIKPANEVFARHQLASRRQLSNESLDQYLQALKLLAKDCGFKSVTAEAYANECIRDAFIAGIASHAIRQRLLENCSLTLDEAMRQARTLDLAQRNSEMYNSTGSSAIYAAATEREQ